MSSSTEERCEWSELLKSSCDHCRKGVKAIGAEPSTMLPVLKDLIEADGTEGVCGVCGEDILAGDYIGQYTTRRVAGMMGEEYVPVFAHYSCGA